MTFKKLVFYIAILALIGIAGYQFFHKPIEVAPLPPAAAPAPVVTSTVNYSCDTGSTINAAFTASSVTVKLSDGRSFDLPQGVSADGAQYKNDTTVFVTKGDQAFLQENTTTTYNNCIADTSGDAVNGTKTFTDQGKTFSFSYPQDFMLAGGGIGYTKTWKTNQDGTLGLILATLEAPANFQPSTNFGDAKFTVGTSADPKAVKGCLADTSGQGVTKSVVTINGVPFTKFVSVDAGAGNRYETNSFRTIENQQCYTIEYTIHYAVLENFDPNSGIKAYNVKTVHDTLDGIVNSFTFLPQ
jgi:membrane-bound inhibitor of C-type lysozyme